MDLMATAFNWRVPIFVSPFDHPEACAVDARSINWNVWSTVYVFPPPIMLKEILPKIMQFEGTIVVVARPALPDPIHDLMYSTAESILPLLEPPRQMVRGKWIHDSDHQYSNWIAFSFSKMSGQNDMVQRYISERLSKCNRLQTNTQQQIAWKALQNWIKRNPEKPIDKSSLLLFMIDLCKTKGSQPQTIKNYRSALRKPLKLICNIDLSSEEFKDLDRALFLLKPPNSPRMPNWSLTKVLNLSSSEYKNDSCTD